MSFTITNDEFPGWTIRESYDGTFRAEHTDHGNASGKTLADLGASIRTRMKVKYQKTPALIVEGSVLKLVLRDVTVTSWTASGACWIVKPGNVRELWKGSVYADTPENRELIQVYVDRMNESNALIRLGNESQRRATRLESKDCEVQP